MTASAMLVQLGNAEAFDIIEALGDAADSCLAAAAMVEREAALEQSKPDGGNLTLVSGWHALAARLTDRAERNSHKACIIEQTEQVTINNARFEAKTGRRTVGTRTASGATRPTPDAGPDPGKPEGVKSPLGSSSDDGPLPIFDALNMALCELQSLSRSGSDRDEDNQEVSCCPSCGEPESHEHLDCCQLRRTVNACRRSLGHELLRVGARPTLSSDATGASMPPVRLGPGGDFTKDYLQPPGAGVDGGGNA